LLVTFLGVVLIVWPSFLLGFLAGCGWAAAHQSRRTLKVVK
jgi:hypothetical protein